MRSATNLTFAFAFAATLGLSGCGIESTPAPLVKPAVTTPPTWPGTTEGTGTSTAPQGGATQKPTVQGAPSTAPTTAAASTNTTGTANGSGSTNANDTSGNTNASDAPQHASPGSTAAPGTNTTSTAPGNPVEGEAKPSTDGKGNTAANAPDASKPSGQPTEAQPAAATPQPAATPTKKPSTIADQVKASLNPLPAIANQSVPAFGACVNLEQNAQETASYTAVGCDQQHKGQIVGYVDLSALPATPPPVNDLNTIAGIHCKNLGDAFIQQKMSDRGGLAISWTAPARSQWAAGARAMVCMVTGTPSGSGIQTTPLQGDLRTNREADQAAQTP